MTVMPGVFLDHVNQDPAHRHRFTMPFFRAGLVQRPDAGEHCTGALTLGPPGGKRFVGIGVIHVIEVAIAVDLGVKQRGSLGTGEDTLEPIAFHFGHVPDQTQQREGRGRNRSLPELLDGEVLALERQSFPMILEPGYEHGELSRMEGWIDSGICHRVTLQWAIGSPLY